MAIRQPLFCLPLDLGTITAASAYAGFPAANLNRHNAIGLTWKSAQSSGTHFVYGDFGSAQTVDFLAIISANALSGTQFTLRLGTSSADVAGAGSYNSGAQTFISPSITRVDGLYHAFFELPSAQTYRWWSLYITSHAADFQAADIVLGQKIIPGRFYNYDFQPGVRDLGDIAFAPNGVVDETPGAIWRTQDFTLSWVSETEWETQFRPLAEKIGRRGVVYCCFDPQATAYRQNRTYMGFMDKALFARGVRKPLTYSMDFSFVSFI